MAKVKKQPRARSVEYKAPILRLGYDAWFDAKVGAKQLSASIKIPLAKHMKAYGFFDSGDFEKGLKHYGA